MKKFRIISAVLAMIMALSVITIFPASASITDGTLSGTIGDNASWTLDVSTGELVVSGKGALTNTYSDTEILGDMYKAIRTVKIESGITDLGEWQFLSVNTIYIPDTLQDKLFTDDFGGTGLLGSDIYCQKIVLDENNPYMTYKDGVLYNKDMTQLLYCEQSKSAENFYIPDSVEYIFNEAFKECNNIKNIFIPASLKRVGVRVFDYWTVLQNIYCYGDINDEQVWHRMEDLMYDSFGRCEAKVYYNYDGDTPASNAQVSPINEDGFKTKTYANILNVNILGKSDGELNFSSSNKNIFYIKEISYSNSTYKVNITCRASGKAYLVIKNSKDETIKKYAITVLAPVASIKTDKSSVKLNRGKEAAVKATSLKGKYNNGKIKWYTNSKTKMKVVKTSKNTQAVRIKGLKKGTCYLVAKNSDGKILKRIRVTVK